MRKNKSPIESPKTVEETRVEIGGARVEKLGIKL